MAITGFTGSAQLDVFTGAEQKSNNKVVETVYAQAVMDNFVTLLGGHDTISGSPTKAYTKLGSLSAADLTQGTDASPTALSDTERTVTISERGVGVAYGDLLDIVNSVAGGRARVFALMGKAYADWIEQKLLALNASFTPQVAGSGNAMSDDYLLQMINKLETQEMPGPYFGILHTMAVHHLRSSWGTTQAVAFSRPGIIDRVGPAMESAYVSRVFEVDLFKSSNCPLDASSANKVSVMLPMNPLYFPVIRLVGVPTEGPFAGQEHDGRIEEQRDASGRLTEFWITGAWGCDVRDLNFGCGCPTKVAA